MANISLGFVPEIFLLQNPIAGTLSGTVRSALQKRLIDSKG